MAVVTCVEAGYLESQTIRMIESLRNWGGRFASLPVVAVTPRFGPSIRSSTRRRYDELNVTYVNTKPISNYAWYNFMNKPTAILAAERTLQVDLMIWLDADLLIVAEPWGLLLDESDDFTACPTEKNVATTGPGDPYHNYWLAMCQAVGLELDEVPWMEEFRSNQRIRTYYNSGVFSYRPRGNLAEAFFDATQRVMEAKIQLPKDGIFYHEQAALGLAAVKQKLRSRILPEPCNYHFGSSTLKFVQPDKLRAASVLHYHRSMQPDRWAEFLPLIQASHPQIMDWLAPKGPLEYRVPLPQRPLNKLLKLYRKRRSEAYLKECRTV